MTTEQLYFQLHLLINENNTLKNTEIEKAHFVALFNRERIKWVNQKLPETNNSDKINVLHEILVSSVPLTINSTTTRSTSFNLPQNYYWLASIEIYLKKDTCKKVGYCDLIHPKEIEVYLKDADNCPSFDWNYTIAELVGNNILKVYKDDFEIDSINLTYWRNPTLIDLAGYIHLDNTVSSNIDSELNDIYLEEILDRTALEIQREFGNGQSFQLAQNRM